MAKAKRIKNDETIEDYLDRIRSLENDTTFTRHGLLTHDPRYKGETGQIVDIIKEDNKISNDQAYYFFYFMTSNDLTYEEAKEQLLSNKEFEQYDALKRARRSEI